MEYEVKDNHLIVDGCDCTELAEQYGTPLFVYSLQEITNRCNQIKTEFIDRYERVRAVYACKAFCTTAMLQIVNRVGLGLDTVSYGELMTAINAGVDPAVIEVNGNNKSYEELELAVRIGAGRIIVDGLDELDLIEEIAERYQKQVAVLFRITPGVDAHTMAYISTGKLDSKFGIPMDDAIVLPLLERAVNSKYVKFMGVHYHVGSQLFDHSAHLMALETVLKLMKQIYMRTGYVFEEINVGGGFGAVYVNEQRRSFRYFLDPIMERLEQFCSENRFPRPAVVIEPGRSIVAEAGLTIYEVGTIKTIPGIRNYFSVNGGMSDNIRVGLYQAEYTGVLANRMNDEKTVVYTAAGKCCESTDILVKDILLPEVKRGDLFVTFSTGAYGYSMASNYNRIEIPAVVLADHGSARLIVKRQTCEQILQNDVKL